MDTCVSLDRFVMDGPFDWELMWLRDHGQCVSRSDIFQLEYLGSRQAMGPAWPGDPTNLYYSALATHFA